MGSLSPFCILQNPLHSFIPEFLKWTLPSLNLDMSTDAKKGHSIIFKKKKNNMANSVHILMRRFITSHLIWIYTVCTVSGLVYRAVRVMSVLVGDGDAFVDVEFHVRAICKCN